MSNNGNNNFIFLNRDNQWPDFKLNGLEIRDDGALQLYTVPLFEGTLPEELENLNAPEAPAGIAVGPDKTAYVTIPSENALFRFNSCSSSLEQIISFCSDAEQSLQFKNPRGLLYHPLRKALFVADSDNHRILVFDIQTFQLADIWGQANNDALEPGSEPGRFTMPWTLDSDYLGNVYVVDYGNRRVQKFDLRGNVIPSFWETAQSEVPELSQFSDIAVSSYDDVTEVYVLDREKRNIFVLNHNGNFLRSFGAEVLENPMGLAAYKNTLYVGDNEKLRILVFKTDGTFIGEAQRYEGPVAALAVDRHNGLWVHSGSDLLPLQLNLTSGHIKKGFFTAGPFAHNGTPVTWHRLRAFVKSLESDAHIQFFVFTSDDSAAAPPLPDSTSGFDLTQWRALPLDLTDGIISQRPAERLFIGAHFTSEGVSSPLVYQIKASFNHKTYSKYLPAIYRNDQNHRDFLDRFLSLFESFFSNTEEDTENLDRYFDTEAAPVDALPWLAGWLALDLDDNWPEEKKRRAIARAFESYAQQGTREGLEKAIRFYAEVDALIVEPILNADWWSLPDDKTSPEQIRETSVLGFSTRLIPAEAQGAVVGTTAILDHSHLLTQEEYGTPLFERVAHQFTVLVPGEQVQSMEKQEEILSVIEREKPAHTTFELCIIKPSMRLGFQSQLGIDSVLPGPLSPFPLGDKDAPYGKLVLSGEPSGYFSTQSHLGRTTLLSEEILENKSSQFHQKEDKNKQTKR
jgi:phage tail-like protein